MQLYSARPDRRAWQIVGDLVAIGVLAIAIWLAGETTRAIESLTSFGVQMQGTGSQLSDTLLGAAEGLEGVPLVGPGLGAPFVEAASAADGLAAAGRTLEDAIRTLALAVGTAVWLVPVLVLVGVWLVPRIRFALRSAQTARIAAGPAGRDLLALRALVARPLPELQAVAPDPLRAIRDADDDVLDALAALELSAAGVRRRPVRTATAGGRR
ncbi:hypothetical protein [Agrococcus sp. SGAir0287]|uniref:hypothetical protein n=1 Tax=Agrococcus sp. SGAir0287 TaxID=2070347 RepID=UPI0010CCEBE3|nr:hypothetical protein [Agrococcus sp. SGAir0287]QCR19339.1 hypothetical protein C1N71_07765 [Agrococcus sp. SGAir0287]